MSQDGRERNQQGQYVETVTLDRVLDAVASADEPFMATGDVADALDCSREAARLKLTELHDQGRIERRDVRGAVVVWWLPAASDREVIA
jgi:predicted transcriptional regulator of viral defense system